MIHRILHYTRQYFTSTELPDFSGLDEPVAAYQRYITESLDAYRYDFETLALDGQSSDLYSRFWRLYFNELIVYANELDLRYSNNLKPGDNLRNRLQEAAEQGLSDFHRLCENFSRTR
jgi:hypothetical protein